MALGTDASVGAPDRRGTEQLADRRCRQRRHSDLHEPSRAGIAADAALATLDKFNRGVFLLDGGGAVCFANRAAEAMLARNDGLRVRRGRLQFEAVVAHAVFEAFLANGAGAADSDSLVLRVGGARRSDPYRVLVSPLVPRHGRQHGGAGHCVFIYEPNSGLRPVPLAVLRQLYGLTASEARLGNELFGGRSLADSARACSISINTAKSVLKRIFTKCAVGTQAELALLLSLGPRTL